MAYIPFLGEVSMTVPDVGEYVRTTVAPIDPIYEGGLVGEDVVPAIRITEGELEHTRALFALAIPALAVIGLWALVR